MGYQLMVWEGSRPTDDAVGAHQCQEMVRRHLTGEPAEPSAAIRAFVKAITEHWPDDPEDPRWEESPWKWPPILDSASGPVILLDLTLSTGPIASCVIASIAEERGLVAFDPQLEMLRPLSEAFIEEYFRHRSASLN